MTEAEWALAILQDTILKKKTMTKAEWAIAMLEEVVYDALRTDHWKRRNPYPLAQRAGLVCSDIPPEERDKITREILYRLEAKGRVTGANGWWQATPREEA